MVDFIKGETKKIMYKCCDKYATSKKMDVSDVQLILGLNASNIKEASNGQNLNTYKICENYTPKKDMTFLEVLGVKIDFLGYSQFAPAFIFKSLVRFADENKIEYDKVSIMCVPSTNEKGKPDILLALYNGANYVDTITFDQLFREEDFELPV